MNRHTKTNIQIYKHVDNEHLYRQRKGHTVGQKETYRQSREVYGQENVDIRERKTWIGKHVDNEHMYRQRKGHTDGQKQTYRQSREVYGQENVDIRERKTGMANIWTERDGQTGGRNRQRRVTYLQTINTCLSEHMDSQRQ